MKRFFLIVILMSSQIFSQTSGLANLKNGVNARDIAMSDLGVVSSGGAASFFYNPALLDGKTQFKFSHNSYIQDVNNEFLGISFSFLDIPLAIGFASTVIPDIEIRTKPGEADGKFDAHYFYGGISSAFNISEELKAGVTAKFIYEGLFSDEANGYAVDFGLIHNNLFIDNLTAGISFKNIGTMEKLRNTATELPQDLRIGLNYTYSLANIKSIVNLTGGMQKYLNSGNSHLHIGAEINYASSFAVRLGYVTGYEGKSISFGGGVIWGNIKFDYAFVPFSYELGNSHFITIGYDL